MDDGNYSEKEEVCEAEKDEESSTSDSGEESVSASPVRKNEDNSQNVEEVQDDWFAKEEKEDAPADQPKQPHDSTTNKGAGDTAINGKKKVKEGKPFTKVVVRRLPPSMTKEVFFDQVSPLPVYDYFYFVPASHSSTPEYSRAYVNFVNQDDLFSFTRTFDNYVFIDTKGHEYPAVVEFAPYQRVPKQRNRKPDTLMGSIENEAAFVAFQEELLAQAVDSGAATKQHYFETEISESGDIEIETTPLVEFVKARKLERARAREERREERRRKEAERKAARMRERQLDPPDSPTSISVPSQVDVKCEMDDLLEDDGDGDTTDPNTAVDLKDNPKSESKNVSVQNDSEPHCVEEKGQNCCTDENQEVSTETDTPAGQGDGRTSGRRWYRAEWWSREPQLRLLAKGEPFPPTTHPTYTVLQKEKKEPKEKEKKSKLKEDKFGKHPSESRTREFKNKGGKSYKEERLKQAERREEKKKKDEQMKEGSGGGVEETLKTDTLGDEQEEKVHDKKKWKYDSGKGRTFRRREDKREGRLGRGGGRSSRLRGRDAEELDDEEPKMEEAVKEEAKVSIHREETRNDSQKEEKKTDTVKDAKKELSKEESKESQISQDFQSSSVIGEFQPTIPDPRVERRIRNKDRPSIEIYRPGMGKFSRQRLEKEKAQGSNEDSPCHSPSPST